MIFVNTSELQALYRGDPKWTLQISPGHVFPEGEALCRFLSEASQAYDVPEAFVLDYLRKKFPPKL